MESLGYLSLFSGIGAFEKALEDLGVGFDLVNYCEIDKFASRSYSAIHGVPESKNLWDVRHVDCRKLPKDLDLVTYGFPCQDISLAGRQRGLFDGNGRPTRSGLFFEALRVIRETKPKVAIAENVKALVSSKFTRQFALIVEGLENAGYNNYWMVLNAKDFGVPQNRERVFILSFRKDVDPGWGEFVFPEPFPLTVKLRDLEEPDGSVDSKYYLSEKMVRYVLASGTGKYVVSTERGINPDVAPALNTCEGSRRAGVDTYLSNGLAIRDANSQGYAMAGEGDGCYISHLTGKRGTVQKDKVPTIKTPVGNHFGLRKLTPKECWRLMGFSDSDFCKAKSVGMSDCQLYKQAGNSIVVPVVRELFSSILSKCPEVFSRKFVGLPHSVSVGAERN